MSGQPEQHVMADVDDDVCTPPKVLNPPDSIWLNYGDIDEDCTHEECADGVTWCGEAIDDSDVRYVRDDLHAALIAERDALRTQLAETGAMPDAVRRICQERDALRQRMEREEGDCLDVMRERDWAQDCLQQTHIALGGDGEWCGKMPAEMPPDSGDLHYDVPALAREVTADRDRLAARCDEAEGRLAGLETIRDELLALADQIRRCAGNNNPDFHMEWQQTIRTVAAKLSLPASDADGSTDELTLSAPKGGHS